MHIGCLTRMELQRLRLTHSVKELALFFEEKESDVYGYLTAAEILHPTKFVAMWANRGLRSSFVQFVAQYGVAKMSRCFGVSKSYLAAAVAKEPVFLKGDESSHEWVRLFLEELNDTVNQELFFLQAQVDRLGSTSLVKRMYFLLLKKDPGIKSPPPKVRNMHLGQHKSTVGRKMELLTMEYFPGEDMNLSNPHSEYDILSKDFGRINVKALSSEGRWRMQKVDKCDHVALVCMTGNDPKFICLIPSEQLPVTVTVNNYSKYPHVLLTKQLFL